MTATADAGRRLDRLAELEEERRYLLRSLKDLERERAAGDVDEHDYATLKDGYTVRAAAVLRQIDEGRRSLTPRRPRDWKKIVAIVVVAAVCATGIGLVLASAFGERGADDQITGFNPGDNARTKLASARAALGQRQFVEANQLFFEVDKEERARGDQNAEALTYFGWTFALIARQSSETLDPDDDRITASLLALKQAIEIEPTYADPYCFVAIIEYSFRDDPDAALPYVEQCQAANPPVEVAKLVSGFADEIRAAVTSAPPTSAP